MVDRFEYRDGGWKSGGSLSRDPNGNLVRFTDYVSVTDKAEMLKVVAEEMADIISALTKREAWSHSECLRVLTKYENATEEK